MSELYFFGDPLNEEKAIKALRELGFRKELKHGGYRLGNFIINFTDYRESRIQLQGKDVDDVFGKGKESRYYITLEQVARILCPKKIIDCGFSDMFPELVRN